MSRIIVKNLPSGMTETRLRELFAVYGTITDCALKYNADGAFRKFAFVGFKGNDEASTAIKYRNQSFIDTTKIEVCIANDLSAAHVKTASRVKAIKQIKPTTNVPDTASEKPIKSGKNVGEAQADAEDEHDNTLSDAAFLKSKMAPTLSDDSSESDDDDEDIKDRKEYDKNKSTVASSGAEGGEYKIVMRGLPSNVKETQIREFFRPISLVSVNIPKNARRKKSICVVTVVVGSESDCADALRRNKNCIGSKKIFLNASRESSTNKNTSKSAGVKTGLKHQQDCEQGGEEIIAESGRLFLRNLAYCCTEEDLESLFSEFGPLEEVHLPIDSFTKKVKGFAFVTFVSPENAIKAFNKLDGTIFQGRMLHLVPGQSKKNKNEITDEMPFGKKKELLKKASAASMHNWNTLFVGANAVTDAMASKYETKKSDILLKGGKQSVGVRVALGETQIVAETRQFLLDNNIALDSFSQAAGERSKTVILVKHLPAGTTVEDLRVMFERYGTLGRLVLPPSGLTALIEYVHPTEARAAFIALAYTKHVPLYLEWAPMGVFTTSATIKTIPTFNTSDDTEEKKTTTQSDDKEKHDSNSDSEHEVEAGSTLFVKNLHFDTTEETLREKFSKYGRISDITIARKADKKAGKLLSMGYGFVAYRDAASAQEAIKHLQHATINEHTIELKVSNRVTLRTENLKKKRQDADKKQISTKILIRNIPFEAKTNEIMQLFTVFGELKSVRVPKKLRGTHRGFGFVDFLSKDDAKRAFNALCHSTHLYGRRLVLEWAEEDDTVESIRKKTSMNYSDDGPRVKRKKSSLLDELNLGSSGS